MGEVRHSLRVLLKQPLFSAVVIITCALGIGANTAVFSVVNAVMLRPLPFHQPGRLVMLFPYDERQGPPAAVYDSAASYPDFVDWRAQNRVFEHVAVYTNESLTLTNGREAVQVQGEAVSADLFSVLGVQPVLGRAFIGNEDEPGNRVVILSHALWQRRFGGDPNILGKAITLDQEQFQVVGVMPPGFSYPVRNTPIELWTTVAMLRESKDGGQPMTEVRGNDFLGCIARLKSGISLTQAQADMDIISGALRHQYPDSNTGLAVKVIPLLGALVSDARSGLLMICAMAGCVLLVACLNLANLFLARSMSRRKEIDIRAALGAGRWQITRHLVSESVMLSVIGGAAGLLLAQWGLDLLKAFLPSTIPRIDEISLDLSVLTFAAVGSVFAGLMSGLLPAWRITHPGLTNTLKDTARGSTEGAGVRRTRALLVVLEIVFALVLLASAGLLARTFLRLQDVRPGFVASNVATGRIALPKATYVKPEQVARFYKTLLAKITQLPGVESGSVAWWLPLTGSEATFNFDIEEHPMPLADQPVAQVNAVGLNYFKTLGVPVVQGRDFTSQDDVDSPPVALVSEEFVRQFFPGENPIGKRIKPSATASADKPRMREIVGVVHDMHLISLSEKPKPQIYIPHSQFATHNASLVVRSRLSLVPLIETLRRTVAELDKDVPLFRPQELSDYASQSMSEPRFNALLVGLFALIALLLAAAGIFGLTSYTVTQRTPEIGIRMALGAQRGDVLRLILVHGMRLLLIGVGLGVAAVIGAGHLLQSLLFGIGAHDLTTLVGVTLILSLVTLIACWIPARRATRVNPVIALRSE